MKRCLCCVGKKKNKSFSLFQFFWFDFFFSLTASLFFLSAMPPPFPDATPPRPRLPFVDRLLGSVLSLVSAGGFLAGFCLLVAGLSLQTPPSAPVPAGLVSLGVLTTLAAVAVALGRRFRWALVAYFAFGALSVVFQLAVVGAIFASPERAAASIAAADGGGLSHALEEGAKKAAASKAGKGGDGGANVLTPERAAQIAAFERAARDSLIPRLDAVKWCFLVIALAEAVGLGAAAWKFVRTEVRWRSRYEGLDAGEAARLRGVELRDALRQGLGMGGGGGGGSRSKDSTLPSSASSASSSRFVSGVTRKNEGGGGYVGA